MAAQQVQAYIERHRIGALFEDLMAKVIKDTPEEPISYLIKVLKKMSSDGTSKGPGSLLPPSGPTKFSRSMGISGNPVTRHSFDEGRSMLAKSWGGPDSHTEGSKYRSSSASKAGRDYPRPWLSGSKSTGKSIGDKDNMRPQARTAHTQNNDERPQWNHKTSVPSHDFDEWFSMQHRPTKTSIEHSQEYQGTSSWGRNVENEKEVPAERTVVYSRRRSSTRPVNENADDNLEEEFYTGRESRQEVNDLSSVISHESVRSRKQNARHAAEEHRRQLQALLLNKSPTREDVNGFNNADELQDEGTELLENVDELESEGVSNLNRSGAKLSKSVKQGSSTAESIRVSICARCAKVITGQPSDQKSEVRSIYSASEADDDFESASQVGNRTGLNRPPVWPSGFDSESDSSPRKGSHMWQSPSRTPVKGKHMFRGGSFADDHRDSSRPPTASSSRSDLVYSESQQNAWKFDGYSSENDTEANYDGVASPEFGGSRPWQRTQLESGSETDWDPRPGRPTQGFNRYYSGEESDSA